MNVLKFKVNKLLVCQTLNCNENRFYGSNELDINIRINLLFYDFKSPSMSDSDLQRGFPQKHIEMHFSYQSLILLY